MKNILIVGGTGTLGKELARRLQENKYCVSVLSRNPEKSADLVEAGIELLRGDMLDKASLTNACKGMDCVIAAAHAMLGKGKYASEKIDGKGQKDLIDATASAGVKYFIFLSVIGATPDHPVDFWRTKWQTEAYLKQSGMSFNIIRASAFMEFHIGEMMGKNILKKDKVTLFGKGDNPTNFVSVKDVATLILLCLNDALLHNQVLEIGGPDNPTRLDIIKMYETKIGKPVKVSHVPNGALRFLSKIIKPFHPGLSRVMFLADHTDHTDQTFDTRPLLKTLPMQLTSVADFIGTHSEYDKITDIQHI